MQEENMNKISSFTDLKAWKEAHKLTLCIYKNIESFPECEKFGLSDQLRRSISSVSANIAEGFGRQTAKDKIHFYHIANGSLNETQNHLLVARDLGYLKQKYFKEITEKTILTSKLLNGLIKSIKSRN
ncbi:MAG: four helix bundle protein [Candidatus Pacebacteria bacterium]|nr:four helix bundle protein [Candidatus Paceibacterota bacterium]